MRTSPGLLPTRIKMKVSFDASRERGSQYTVTMNTGAIVANVSMATAMGLLQGDGRSIRQASIIIAEAKAAAVTAPAAA
jgi:hypothetical protein